METKGKADELVKKFSPKCAGNSQTILNRNLAIGCALIAVNEIIDTDMLIDEDVYVNTVSYLGFWQGVKIELEKMRS